jgi:hypothetical protein
VAGWLDVYLVAPSSHPGPLAAEVAKPSTSPTPLIWVCRLCFPPELQPVSFFFLLHYTNLGYTPFIFIEVPLETWYHEKEIVLLELYLEESTDPHAANDVAATT